MKLKILIIGIMLLMTSSMFVSANSKIETDADTDLDVITVNVALFADEKLGWGSGRHLFNYMFKDYSWTVGNKTYKFVITEIFDKDIINGDLNTDNYDMLLCPGGGVGDANSIVRGLSSFSFKTHRWKKAINDFIKDGGGYCGFCGGAAIATNFYINPGSIPGRIYDAATIGFSEVEMYMGDGRIGFTNTGTALYMGSEHKPRNLDDPDNIMNWRYVDGGICLDMQIQKDNPIFDDYLEDKCRVRWVGGPALIVPDDCNRDTSVLAKYPEEKISENSSLRLHYWKYTGGILGFIKGYIKAWQVYKEYNKTLPPKGHAMWVCASDWEKTDNYIEFNFSNKPGILSEIYPNENKARIVLNGLHPEYPMWFGGDIVESEDTDHNSWYEGLYHWENRSIWEETPEDEFTYTWWIVRRSVAWSAKIPDNDLPPVYGPSHVCDFEQNVRSRNFTIHGNSETAAGITSLDLYYRHSNDNANWSQWTLFKTDANQFDGWSWDFNSPNGTGYYEFYSIRNVEYEGYTENEKVPPGADAIVFVEEL